MDVRGKHCLVTGATDPVATRLIAALHEGGAGVRMMAPDLATAADAARFPVEIVPGSTSDESLVRSASEAADILFHFGEDEARADQRRQGTIHVAEAARSSGARLVHVSDAFVYGRVSGGSFDETQAHAGHGDDVLEAERDAEREVRTRASGKLEATIVQPTIVYGPGSRRTTGLFDRVESGAHLVLQDSGLCNAVYLDDVVRGLLLAATREEAVGETFLLNGPTPLSWNDYVTKHEEILGRRARIELTADEAHSLWNRLHGSRGVVREGLSIFREREDLQVRLEQTSEIQMLLRAARLVLPERFRRKVRSRLTRGKHPEILEQGASRPSLAWLSDMPPDHAMPPREIEVVRSRAHARSDKAQRLLGYEPRIDWEEGMRRVGRWADWAGYLGARRRAL